MGIKINAITVQVERTIEVGRSYYIHPSEEYLGIENGLVKVSAIIPTEEVPSCVDLDVYREFEEDPSVVDTWQWVVYAYDSYEEGALDYFPVHEFAHHISQW